MALATYAKSCVKNVAGNSQIWLTEAANITSITIVAGEVTVFTMSGVTKFLEVEPDRDVLLRTQEGAGIGSNISYTHKIEMKFSKLSTGVNTLRNSLADASPCGIVAVVKDSNGTYWLVGWNASDLGTRGLELRTDNDTSGLIATDAEGGKASIVLETISGYLDLPLTAAGVTSFDLAKTDA